MPPSADAPAPSASLSSPAVAAPGVAARSGGTRRLVGLGVAALVVAGGVAYWLHQRQLEETDDAQIDANITNVSPRIAGTVKAVHVVENQVVKAGDLLAEIDTADLDVAVALSKATVAQAEAQLRAEDPSVPITQTSNAAAVANAAADTASTVAGLAAAKKDIEQIEAQLAQAEANNRTAQVERDRAEKLIQQGAISEAEHDLRANTAAAAQASVDALRQALAAARDRVLQQQAHLTAAQSRADEVRTNGPRQLETRRASVLFRQASLDAARAQLAQAELNVSYAKIVAPASGIIGKKSISVGDHVAPGQQIMALAQVDKVWVTANFRETQLERIHPGLAATLHVDAIDADLRGTIESIGGATGSRFSVLPPENASGNYVKVVQRIPVRIEIDPGQPGLDRLRPGMSVEPEVKVR